MKRVLALVIGILPLSVAHAATIHVPADQPTIQAGVNAAANGDTVLVSPGTYSENVEINGKAVALIGLDGPDVTILRPLVATSATVKALNVSASGLELKGLTIQEGGATYTVVIDNSNPLITGNVFRNNIPVGSRNIEVISCSGAAALITRNVFYGNGGIGCVGLRTGSAQSRIINNTFDGNERGFYSIAGGGTALNNIVTHSLTYGVAALDPSQYTLLDYNDVWGNGTNYMTGVPGLHDISADPEFQSAAEHLYGLLPSSPCIDAGDPDPQYNDSDGTRNDIGAFSSPRSLPVAGYLTVNGASFCFITPSPEISWTFVDTGFGQTGYHIQVGSDTDWTVAELWDTGPVSSASASVAYAGSPLINSQTYYVRVQVQDALGWGDWNRTSFTYHTGGIIRVPEDAGTIQAAIDLALTCDTVEVGPGTYYVNLTVNGKGPLIRSRDGAAVTFLRPSNTSSAILAFTNSPTDVPELRGFTIEGGGATYTVVANNASPHIVGNIFRNNIPFGSSNVEVISCTNASALIERNVFYGNGGIGCVGLRPGSAGSRIINNTFNGNERGFYSIAGGGTALNNIVTNSQTYGVAALSPSQYTLLDYNDVWGNGTNYMTGVPGVHDISADPQYMSIPQHDFALGSGSPCINGGDPDPIYNDSDGTRNDIGAIPYLPHPPLPASLIYPPDSASNPVYAMKPQFRWHHSMDPEPNDTIRYTLQLSLTPGFSMVFSVDSILDTSYTLIDSLQFGTQYWWRVVSTDLARSTAVSAPGSFWTWTLGDVNRDHTCDIGDLSKLVDFFFHGEQILPQYVADMDGSCTVDIGDLTYLVDHLFGSGPKPKAGC